MVTALLRKIFGSKNERELKRLQPIIQQINSLEKEISRLSDNELKSSTPRFRERLALGATPDDILPEAFGVVREVAKRTVHMRPFDVQLVGGIVLHQGKIAEMKTGEGKTLVATLPVYLNALTGRGVHIVTVNDYLARRDAEWMGPIYRFLGLDVGVIVHGISDAERKSAYQADIAYGTNNEFGFDYLRDNMKFKLEDYVQRELHYAIVDEVDSILIDEARTPLIISGPAEESTQLYYSINQVIPRLNKPRREDLDKGMKMIEEELRPYRENFDCWIDEKSRSAFVTETGIVKLEKLLRIPNLYDPANIEIVHHVNQALKAHTLFQRDVDYVVKNGEVIIVDEFTGRLMPGRRYSDGLHQALEAKERVKVERENQTLATITFQNYFRMYDKLAGMTGTADTEASEFSKIYNLDVMVIPTNMPMIRNDQDDLIYKTEVEKFRATVREIKELHQKGQPVLVGTISIEKSEKLSKMLDREGLKHQVLNAKHHEREADIIAQAGRKDAITISTNMAGRGTDIMLGGNPEKLAGASFGKDESPEDIQAQMKKFRETCNHEKVEVIEAGGLHILGTERHESRRIDNQLRGRSGRQGDPGSSRFYLSLEDDLLRIFGSERISRIMDRLGMEEDQPIEHGLVSRAIENAQKKVEGQNFEIRKRLLEYDDVMNQQRTVVYKERRNILSAEDPRPLFFDILTEIVEEIAYEYGDPKTPAGEWDWDAIKASVLRQLAFPFEISADEFTSMKPENLAEMISDQARAFFNKKEEEFGSENMTQLLHFLLLSTLDTLWKEHLLGMDHLKEGISLRGYGQKDPLQEYKREGYDMFTQMIGRFKADVVEKLFRIQIRREEELERMEQRRQKQAALQFGRGGEGKAQTVKRKSKKVGRNDPCPCGSGLKHKKCCGK